MSLFFNQTIPRQTGLVNVLTEYFCRVRHISSLTCGNCPEIQKSLLDTFHNSAFYYICVHFFSYYSSQYAPDALEQRQCQNDIDHPEMANIKITNQNPHPDPRHRCEGPKRGNE